MGIFLTIPGDYWHTEVKSWVLGPQKPVYLKKFFFVDENNNGRVDTVIMDLDENGVIDSVGFDENENNNFEIIVFDDDEDGNVDRADLDTDDNGSSDIVAYDYNQDGEWDKFEDAS